MVELFFFFSSTSSQAHAPSPSLQHLEQARAPAAARHAKLKHRLLASCDHAWQPTRDNGTQHSRASKSFAVAIKRGSSQHTQKLRAKQTEKLPDVKKILVELWSNSIVKRVNMKLKFCQFLSWFGTRFIMGIQ
jgi:hypothetical protein